VLLDEVRFWPRVSSDRVSVDGYCRRGLPAGAHCIKCETPLALSDRDGVSDAEAPLTRDIQGRLSAY
jgi:hypothetical protein